MIDGAGSEHIAFGLLPRLAGRTSSHLKDIAVPLEGVMAKTHLRNYVACEGAFGAFQNYRNYRPRRRKAKVSRGGAGGVAHVGGDGRMAVMGGDVAMAMQLVRSTEAAPSALASDAFLFSGSRMILQADPGMM